jgi:hypothetical protein
MARVPTVGSKELHSAQLSPQERRLRYKRAKRANQREYRPVLEADRQAIGAVNRDYQNEASSIRGATSMTENALAQALAGLRSSGLSGSYLRQAISELTARQGDAAASVPFLLSDARGQRSDALGEARQQLIDDRAAMQQGTAQDFNALLKEGRGEASQVLKEQAEARESGGEGAFDPAALGNAKLALKDALNTWGQNPMVPGPDGEEIPLRQLNPLRSKDDWLRFAAGLDHQYSGFGLAEINAVISELLRNREEKMHQGRLPQPGVPGAGRG